MAAIVVCSQTCSKNLCVSGTGLGDVGIQSYLRENPRSHLAHYVDGERRHV